MISMRLHFAMIQPRTIEKVALPIIPNKVYCLNVRALYSDCDDNDHVNQATYLKWCSDAASEGAINGCFRSFNKHIELYPLKDIELYYSGEGHLNDELVVKVWECLNNSMSLAFAIEKKGSKMNLWSMSKLFECIRYAVLPYGFGHFDRLKDDEHSIFMASTAYYFTEYGNTLNTRPHWGMNFPLHAALDIIYSGTSAFSFKIKLTNYENGKLLISAVMTFVYIDYNTRKPAPFPDWYVEAKKVKSFGSSLPRLATPEIPENAFKYEVKSSYSDIDHNGHVNQSIYVKWCTDAGTEAALNGLYSGFKDNIGKYELDSLEIKYIGEGFVEERFEVNTWQDKVSPLVLHFAITKLGQLTLVAKFTYKSSEIGSRL